MLLGYADEKIRKVCEDGKAARKRLPQDVAQALPRRLAQLAAFNNQSEIPTGTPLHHHRLSENWAGHYSVHIDKKYRIVFKPIGEYGLLSDGTPDLKTVTSIEIAAVEDYH